MSFGLHPRKTQRVLEDRTYARDVLPRELEIQVLAFMRIVWPDVFEGEGRFRTCLWPDEHAVHFVRINGDLLMSHVQIVRPDLQDEDRALRIAGVGAMMTYPQFRREGHGAAVLQRATDYIRTSRGLDVGMLFCDAQVASFYERLGWRRLANSGVQVGDVEADDLVMTFGNADALPEVLRLRFSW